MLKYLRQHGEQGQTAILLAFAMIGLLGIVGLALDGGMLYWNQRRAQNGADAAAIAGVTKLADHVINATCDSGSEQEVLNLIHEYAGVNEVPNANTGENVEAFYLIENSSGDRVVLTNSSGQPWHVGETGAIPCDRDPVGLQVKASFPQQTFLAGVIGIAETNVTVDASAIFKTDKGCDSFVLLALNDDPSQTTLALSGSEVHIREGGVHSNGGLHVTGSDLTVEDGKPVEYGDGAVNNSKDLNGQDRIVEAPPVGGDNFYEYKDFTEGGFIYQEVEKWKTHNIVTVPGDLGNSDVRDADGNLIDGLYVVSRDVHLNSLDNQSAARPWRVTIAAKGCIQFSGGVRARPYARGVFLYSDCDNTSNGAIKLSGDDNTWGGLIMAPNGDVNLSAAKNRDFSGMIVGQRISVSGSNNNLRHHPNYCPPDPPRVLLIQ
jgi:Flp pilus assembly protein TadG